MNSERVEIIKKRLSDRELKYPTDMKLFDDNVCIRDLEEVASRAIISAIMAKCAFDLYEAEDPLKIIDETKRELNKFGVLDLLFIEETEVLTKEFNEPLCDTIGWRFESARALLWALGYIESIDDVSYPNDIQTEINQTYELITKFHNRQEFLSVCKMRKDDELADMYQTFWYYHWNIVDRLIFKKLSELVWYDVVIEKRRALQWLIYSEIDENNSWNGIRLHT